MLIVEPWAEELPLPPDLGLLLIVEGEASESMSVFWRPRGVTVYPPRYTVLKVMTRNGDEIARFDTNELPSFPPVRHAQT